MGLIMMMDSDVEDRGLSMEIVGCFVFRLSMRSAVSCSVRGAIKDVSLVKLDSLTV